MVGSARMLRVARRPDLHFWVIPCCIPTGFKTRAELSPSPSHRRLWESCDFAMLYYTTTTSTRVPCGLKISSHASILANQPRKSLMQLIWKYSIAAETSDTSSWPSSWPLPCGGEDGDTARKMVTMRTLIMSTFAPQQCHAAMLYLLVVWYQCSETVA